MKNLTKKQKAFLQEMVRQGLWISMNANDMLSGKDSFNTFGIRCHIEKLIALVVLFSGGKEYDY